jgi:hypothetical protein
MQDNRGCPGPGELGQVLFVGQKGQVPITGLSQGGQAGDRPPGFTGERQTKAICQFSQ